MMTYPPTGVTTAIQATPVPEQSPNAGITFDATWLTLAALITVTAAWFLRRYRTRLAHLPRRLREVYARRRTERIGPNDTAPAAPAQPAPEPHNAGAGSSTRRIALVFVLIMAALVSGVAVVALVLNYQHGRELAALNGEHGIRAVLWPLAVDGLLIAASLVGLVRKLLSLSVGFRARSAFIIGIIASAGANIVLALHSDIAGWLLAERIAVMTWPTAALLCAHEMGLQMISHYARLTDVFGVEAPNPRVVDAEQRRQEAEQTAEHYRQEYVDLAARVTDLHTTLSRVQRDNEQLRAELDSLDSEQAPQRAETERTVRDWEQIRSAAHEWARQHKRDHGTLPTGSQLAREFGASERWAHKQLRILSGEDAESPNSSRLSGRALAVAQ